MECGVVVNFQHYGKRQGRFVNCKGFVLRTLHVTRTASKRRKPLSA